MQSLSSDDFLDGDEDPENELGQNAPAPEDLFADDGRAYDIFDESHEPPPSGRMGGGKLTNDC